MTVMGVLTPYFSGLKKSRTPRLWSGCSHFMKIPLRPEFPQSWVFEACAHLHDSICFLGMWLQCVDSRGAQMRHMSHSWLALQARGTARSLAAVESVESWGHPLLTNIELVNISREDSPSSSLKHKELNQMVSKATSALIFYASKTSGIMVQLHDQRSMTKTQRRPIHWPGPRWDQNLYLKTLSLFFFKKKKI